jgi:hypothetical protein
MKAQKLKEGQAKKQGPVKLLLDNPSRLSMCSIQFTASADSKPNVGHLVPSSVIKSVERTLGLGISLLNFHQNNHKKNTPQYVYVYRG